MPTYQMRAPDGQTYQIPGPEGATDDQIRERIIAQHPHLGDPVTQTWAKPPDAEGLFGQQTRQINVRAAGEALPGSIAQAGTSIWDAVMNYDKVLAHIKERGFSGIAEDIGTDLKEHYGSLDRAQKTFETDPFRFVMDIASLGSGAGTLAKIGIGTVGRIAEHAIPAAAGRLTKMGAEPFERAAQAGRAGPASWAGREYSAALGGQPSPVQQAVRGAGAQQGLAAVRAAQPFQQAGQAIRQGGWWPHRAPVMGEIAMDLMTGGHAPGLTMAAGMAGSSPHLMGAASYGAGRMGAALPSARGAGTAALLGGGTLTREAILKQAQEALKDKEFKKGKTTEQLNPVRKVARDPNADSKAMTAAQRVLGGYRPLKLTVTPEEGAYGGPDAGVPSRQEGGPVTAGKAYSVGDAPGATPDTPKPETFVPDRGPSPAQAAGAAATEGMGWISDAWASILKGEKPPPLPALPEAGKVPSTADPRPTQALGEETAAIAQLAGPPGAAAAKGLGAAALGAAAGKKLLKGAVEEAPRALTAAEKAAPLKDAPFPQYATEYPPIGEPVMTWDAKKGRYYPAKGESPEAAAFLKARDKIREQMKTEGYTPYFDPAKRVHADPEKYPARTVETLDIAPVRREALDKHLAALNAPEVRKRLRDAIKKGQNLGDTADWYAMGQLESEFTKEFGAKEGRTRFLDTFAAPMAATTGGMDPTGNLLLASYLNYLRAGGRSLPTESWQVPKGFGGGKYGVMPNIKQYQTKMEGGGYSAFGEENPKRLDFMRAFLGDRYHPVMDEQMTQGMTPGLSQPPPGTYGLYAKKAIEVGKEQGLNLTPDDVQAIAWAGFKDEAGKPMISHFNDAVERTYRLTGMPRQEIVRRWMRKEIPLYGGAGATIMAPEMAREATGDRQ